MNVTFRMCPTLYALQELPGVAGMETHIRIAGIACQVLSIDKRLNTLLQVQSLGAESRRRARSLREAQRALHGRCVCVCEPGGISFASQMCAHIYAWGQKTQKAWGQKALHD